MIYIQDIHSEDKKYPEITTLSGQRITYLGYRSEDMVRICHTVLEITYIMTAKITGKMMLLLFTSFSAAGRLLVLSLTTPA